MAFVSHIGHFFKNIQARAVAVPFFLFGLLFGSWATLIPVIKEKFAFSDSELGLLMLCLPLGSLLFNTTAARLIQRYGIQRMTLVALYSMITLSCTWIIIPWQVGLVVVLILTGMTNTQLNISMNLCANAIEQVQKIVILSMCHAMFSLGIMFGALLTSTSVGFGLNPEDYMFLNACFAILLATTVWKTIKDIKDIDEGDELEKEKFKLKFPKGALLLMVGISLCTNLTEGAMIDWSSVYMNEIVGADTIYVGWALAAFSSAMVLGRLMGDKIIPWFGASNILF